MFLTIDCDRGTVKVVDEFYGIYKRKETIISMSKVMDGVHEGRDRSD